MLWNAPWFTHQLWSYVSHMFTITNLWIKHLWKASKIFACIVIATQLKINVKNNIYLYAKNVQLLQIDIFQRLSLIFNGCSRQNAIFPGQHQIQWLLKSRFKFHNFPLYEPCENATRQSISNVHYVILQWQSQNHFFYNSGLRWFLPIDALHPNCLFASCLV